MGTTILCGLLAWVVGVICPQSGLDNPAVASSSAAGDLEAFSTIATAHKLVKRPRGILPSRQRKIPPPTAPDCGRRQAAGQGRAAQGRVTPHTQEKEELRSQNQDVGETALANDV